MQYSYAYIGTMYIVQLEIRAIARYTCKNVISSLCRSGNLKKTFHNLLIVILIHTFIDEMHSSYFNKES